MSYLRKRKIHELKTDPQHFDDVISGKKKFELRKNDRDFVVGDRLFLRKTKNSYEQMVRYGFPLVYTGETVMVRIVHRFRGENLGLSTDYVILSIEVIEVSKGGKTIQTGLRD